MLRNCKGQAAKKGPIWDQRCSGKKGFILSFRRNYCHQKAVSDFRKLNSLLESRPFPMPKIGDMTRSMEGFTFASALDLNMGYYHIKLDADAQKLCTIIFPWGKYKYKRLPMGIKMAPDVFQNVVSKLTQDMEYVKTYLDDLLLLTNNTFADHLTKLEMVVARLSIAGMRVNASKSKYFAERI
jgi:dihydroorotate dehydrogenase